MKLKDIECINNYLQRIVNVLLINASFTNNIGLLRGKAGISIFFYHYSEYTGNNIYEEYAGELIDEIYEEIHKGSPVDYVDGLAGLGPAIGYLVKHGFIEADINEVLEDIDKQLQHQVIHQSPHNLDIYYGVTGYGNYFVSRLYNHLNLPETETIVSNRECLLKVIDMLSSPYNSFIDIQSIIHLLSNVFPLGIAQPKVKAYLDYAVDKLETMVYEDTHFGIYPGTFNPLCVAVNLIQASERSGKKYYLEKALYFLEQYESGFRQYLRNDLQSLSSGSLKWSLLYKYLGVKLKDNKYVQLSNEWLNIAFVEDRDSLAGFQVGKPDNIPAMGIVNGYAGIGLALLTLIEECSMAWFDIIPVFLESDQEFSAIDTLNKRNSTNLLL